MGRAKLKRREDGLQYYTFSRLEEREAAGSRLMLVIVFAQQG
jgi:hypothetical protein